MADARSSNAAPTPAARTNCACTWRTAGRRSWATTSTDRLGNPAAPNACSSTPSGCARGWRRGDRKSSYERRCPPTSYDSLQDRAALLRVSERKRVVVPPFVRALRETRAGHYFAQDQAMIELLLRQRARFQ